MLMVTEEKLYKIFEEIYYDGWNRGYVGVEILDPDLYFERFIKECKEPDNV